MRRPILSDMFWALCLVVLVIVVDAAPLENRAAQQNSNTSDLCPLDCDSSITYLDSELGSSHPLQIESPPPGFNVQTWYIPFPAGQFMSKFDVYLSTVAAIVSEALKDWNLRQARLDFVESPRVGIRIAGSGLQVKNVMWTLFTAVKFMDGQEHFGDMNFKTTVHDQVLGVGRYYSKPDLRDPLTLENATTRVSLSSIQHSTGTAIQAKAKPRIQFRIVWTENGKEYRPSQILNCIMNLAINIGEHDADAGNPGIILYNSDGDFRILIRATSRASVQNLKNYIICYALQCLAEGLVYERPGGRFQEFQGLIQWYGKFVGQISLKTGRPAAVELQLGERGSTNSAGSE